MQAKRCLLSPQWEKPKTKTNAERSRETQRQCWWGEEFSSLILHPENWVKNLLLLLLVVWRRPFTVFSSLLFPSLHRHHCPVCSAFSLPPSITPPSLSLSLPRLPLGFLLLWLLRTKWYRGLISQLVPAGFINDDSWEQERWFCRRSWEQRPVSRGDEGLSCWWWPCLPQDSGESAQTLQVWWSDSSPSSTLCYISWSLSCNSRFQTVNL